MIDKLRDPKTRLILAWGLLVICFIGWPISMLTLAKSEPPFVLSLSWLALILTALDILATTDTRKQVEE